MGKAKFQLLPTPSLSPAGVLSAIQTPSHIHTLIQLPVIDRESGGSSISSLIGPTWADTEQAERGAKPALIVRPTLSASTGGCHVTEIACVLADVPSYTG